VSTSPLDREAFAFLAETAERLSHDLDARDALVSLDALQGDTVSAETRAVRARRIGLLSLHANEPKRAADYLTQAIDGGQDDAATLGLVAQARWQAGDAAGARRALAAALAREPQSLELKRLALLIR
jgi:Tfp pilus assembly protein PilF